VRDGVVRRFFAPGGYRALLHCVDIDPETLTPANERVCLRFAHLESFVEDDGRVVMTSLLVPHGGGKSNTCSTASGPRRWNIPYTRTLVKPRLPRHLLANWPVFTQLLVPRERKVGVDGRLARRSSALRHAPDHRMSVGTHDLWLAILVPGLKHRLLDDLAIRLSRAIW